MSRRTGRVTLLTALLVTPMTGLAVAPSAVANTASDPALGPLPWSMSMSVEDDGFAYSNTQLQGEDPARVTGSFALDAAELTLRYRSPPTGATEEVGPRSVNLSVTVSSLYEYRDTNGNERFDLGDEVVNVEPIPGRDDAHLDRLEGPGLVDGARATYDLGDLGTVHWDIRTSPRPETYGGTEVGPRVPIFNITLEDPTTSRRDTRLAPVMRLGQEGLEQIGPQMVEVQGDGARAVLEWSPNATVGTSTSPVADTVLEQHAGQGVDAREEILVILSTQQADRIEHRGQITFQHTRSPVESALSIVKGDPVMFSLGLVAAVTLFGGSAWAKLKESRQGGTS